MPRQVINKNSEDTGPSAEAVATCAREGERALAKLQQVVVDGLRHGFFDYSLTCEVVNGKKRRLVIKAGVSHQFVIPLEEVEALA